MDQQAQQEGTTSNPTITLVLVRGKELTVTLATHFTFWWPDVPVLESISTYHKTSICNPYSWVDNVIATGYPTWA